MPSKSSDKILLYLLTILECVEKLKIYVDGFESADQFFKAETQQAFNASCHLLLAIGEEVKKIPTKLKDEFSFLEWEQVSGLRNRIAHDYRGIDPDVVYKIITNELEILKKAILSMVKLLHIKVQDMDMYLSFPAYVHLQYLSRHSNQLRSYRFKTHFTFYEQMTPLSRFVSHESEIIKKLLREMCTKAGFA